MCPYNSNWRGNGYMDTSFSHRVKEIIKRVPRGKVATYGQIAALAGNHRAARQVAWILHSSSQRDSLPWHRIVNRRGRISIQQTSGYETQKLLLKIEGIEFDENDSINFKKYLWYPSKNLV